MSSAILLESTKDGIQPLSGRSAVSVIASCLEARRWYWRELLGYNEQRIDDQHFIYRRSNGRVWVELFVKTYNQRQIHRGEAMDVERRVEQGIAI